MKRTTLALAISATLASPAVLATDGATLRLGLGEAISNSITDAKAHAWMVEQETPTPWGVWQFGYQNEGHMGMDKRDGIYALYKINYALTDRVQTSFAFGPYFACTTVTEDDRMHYRDTYRLDGLAGPEIHYQFNKNWSAGFSWRHVLFANSKDADGFFLILGYQPK